MLRTSAWYDLSWAGAPDVSNREAQNQCPDHAESEFEIAVDDICENSFNYQTCISSHRRPSGPILVNLTPLDVMNSKALFTFSAFWMRIRGVLLYRPNETSPEIHDQPERQARGVQGLAHNLLCSPWMSESFWVARDRARSRTMSWISRTPSDKSLTREVMGGYPWASNLVFNLTAIPPCLN